MSTAAQPPITNPVRELLQPVTDYKWHILVFCTSAILSSLALTYVYAEKYLAATTILFRPQNITELRQKQSMAFGAPLPTPPFDLIYDNLQILIQSEPVLFPVIYEMGLNLPEKIEYSGPWYVQDYQRLKNKVKKFRDDAWAILKHGRLIEEEPAGSALQGLRDHLKLINHNSYVFYLSYIDKDPQRAARVVDAVASRVVASLVKDEQEPGNQRYQQLKTMRASKEAQIERYQDEIQQLLQTNHTASVSIETQHAIERHFELTGQRTKLEGKIAHARTKLAELEEQSLNRASPATALTPDDYRRLKSERLSTAIELDAMLEQQKTLNAAAATIEGRLGRLPTIQHQYDRLKQDLQTAQRDLVQIADPELEARIQATDAMSQIVIAHKARVPSVPITPIKIYHVSLAGGLAICLSFGMAYIVAFARSDEVAEMVSRTVTNIVAMWDGMERRKRLERRAASPPSYDGLERRRQTERRRESDDI